MKTLRWVIGVLLFVSMTAAVVALGGHPDIGEMMCLSGAIPCITCLLIGIECQRSKWSSTPTPSAASRVVPVVASPFPRSMP